jgi:hypothetical protein
VGASVHEGEGTFPQQVDIVDCVFQACGWVERQDVVGLIGIGNSGGDGPLMGEIRIAGCRFQDARVGIDIADCRRAILRGNTFLDVGEPCRVDRSSAGTVVFEQNTVE